MQRAALMENEDPNNAENTGDVPLFSEKHVSISCLTMLLCIQIPRPHRAVESDVRLMNYGCGVTQCYIEFTWQRGSVAIVVGPLSQALSKLTSLNKKGRAEKSLMLIDAASLSTYCCDYVGESDTGSIVSVIPSLPAFPLRRSCRVHSTPQASSLTTASAVSRPILADRSQSRGRRLERTLRHLHVVQKALILGHNKTKDSRFDAFCKVLVLWRNPWPLSGKPHFADR
ncbi:hypothetical protein HII31_06692 [Pseudocercospora fuligena]|uniref:Uncharacterized protein n=1 Tax=Pseudocercospora fuligena TaxID=685502 RepID=A0A8H6RJK8_9PEZI|nr:hypothetical protein HII31_06692 [Pseudocercospora fuligena]